MKGAPVPDGDHIARLCSGARLDENGNVTGACFRLRPQEAFLSVNWLELLSPDDRTAQLAGVRQALIGKKMSLGARAKLAVLSVGEVRGYVLRESPDARELRVLHEPEEPNDPSHTAIFDLEPDGDLIADLIAEVVGESYPARG